MCTPSVPKYSIRLSRDFNKWLHTEQNEWIYTLKYVYIRPYVVVHLKSLKRQIFMNGGSIWELCNAMFFSQLSYMWIMHRHGARHHICELSHAIFFFITYSICRQSVYIELLFMCISHLSRLWKNQEWKQGLQSRQWYLLKHISRWLQGAPQRRIQRQMTSPISHPRCML